MKRLSCIVKINNTAFYHFFIQKPLGNQIFKIIVVWMIFYKNIILFLIKMSG